MFLILLCFTDQRHLLSNLRQQLNDRSQSIAAQPNYLWMEIPLVNAGLWLVLFTRNIFGKPAKPFSDWLTARSRYLRHTKGNSRNTGSSRHVNLRPAYQHDMLVSGMLVSDVNKAYSHRKFNNNTMHVKFCKRISTCVILHYCWICKLWHAQTGDYKDWKEPSSIFSTFFPTFGDFGITRMRIFFT